MSKGINSGYGGLTLVAVFLAGLSIGHNSANVSLGFNSNNDSGVALSLDTAEGEIWEAARPEYQEQWRQAALYEVNRALRYIQGNPGQIIELHCGPGGCASMETVNNDIEFGNLEF